MHTSIRHSGSLPSRSAKGPRSCQTWCSWFTPHQSLVLTRSIPSGLKHGKQTTTTVLPRYRQLATRAVSEGSGNSQHAQHDAQDRAAAWLAQPAATPNNSATGRWQLLERRQFAGGWLELVRWEEAPSQRLLRVWLPPGYYLQPSSSKHVRKQPPPSAGWPVMYLNDGQNLFEDKLSFSGRSWSAAHTAQHLISSGALPPFVIVGMDHAGAQRSYEYTPYKPGTGPKGWRSDAANWPGGGVQHYVNRVVQQVLPWAESTYAVSDRPERRGFGGSSFGGICTLCMAMRHPTVFDSLLVESPSLWIDNERFLRQDIAQHKGQWPPHIYAAMGGAEYKNDGTTEFSGMLVQYLEQLVEMLDKQGASKGSALRWRVVEKAGHNEAAWAERLPEALQHLCSHWHGV